jgi:hypothetical protein
MENSIFFILGPRKIWTLDRGKVHTLKRWGGEGRKGHETCVDMYAKHRQTINIWTRMLARRARVWVGSEQEENKSI